MGLYDEIHVWSKCPYCGEAKGRNGQTKDMDCLLEHFSTVSIHEKKCFSSQKELKGYGFFDEDFDDDTKAPDNLKYVTVHLSCSSPICVWNWNRYSILTSGYKWGGGGRFWRAKIPIEIIDGFPRFIDKITAVELDYIAKVQITEEQLNGYKKKMDKETKARFNELLKLYKNEFLALYYL